MKQLNMTEIARVALRALRARSPFFRAPFSRRVDR